MHKARQKWRLACMVVAAMMPPAFGQGTASTPIAVAPVVVRMDTQTEFSSVEVSNRGDRPTSVEIEVVRVRWTDGREQYERTGDFTVSPPVFRMQAGKSRVIRFKFGAQRQETEGFYRLFIHQLPEETAASQVSMVFKLGVPIFIAPLSPRPSLMLVRSTGPDRPPELHNTGNVTLTVVELDGQGCPAGPQKVLARLSPEQKLVLRDSVMSCTTSARTDLGVVQLTAR